jgi:hypothetical protein
MSEHTISLASELDEHLKREAARRNVPPARTEAWIKYVIEAITASALPVASLTTSEPLPPLDDRIRQQMDKLAEQMRAETRPTTAAQQSLSEHPVSDKHSLREFSGLGKQLWHNLDAQQYIDVSRADRDTQISRGSPKPLAA